MEKSEFPPTPPPRAFYSPLLEECVANMETFVGLMGGGVQSGIPQSAP